MLFSSSAFIFIFLPLSLVGFQLLSRFGRSAMLGWLTFASLAFYGLWNPRYLVVLCGSMVMNFLFSLRLGERGAKSGQTVWLASAITANLLLLAYFKYFFPVFNFLHDHHAIHHSFANVLLPLGISFFTFTQIAYLIDLRQGIATRQGFLPYSVFVTLFPHLIAGPIIHPRELMPQLQEGCLHKLRVDDFALGITWFVLGLCKKVLIADRIAPLADLVYAHPHSAGFVTTWLGTLCYAFQLYFDFSGYSDMALGLARMFGIRFPINFNSPLKSQSIIDFWQTWHMTLSRYLNEYLYTPMLRSINGRRLDRGRKISLKAAATPSGFAAMVATPTLYTMFLAGIWHGAGLQFIAFGLLHGVFLTINHAWRLLTPRGTALHRKVPAPVMVLVTFICFLTGTIFFRADSFSDATHLLATMLSFQHGAAFSAFPFLSELPSTSIFLAHEKYVLLVLAVCFFIVWAFPNTQEILGQTLANDKPHISLFPRLSWRVTWFWSLATTALFCIATLLLEHPVRFLYFQF